MVRVQMGEENGVHVFGVNSSSLQLGQQPSFLPPAKSGHCSRIGRVTPQPSIYQNGAPLGAKQEPSEMDSTVIWANKHLRVTLLIRGPGFQWNIGEHLGQGDGEIYIDVGYA
jgi:hypothetical protein